MASYYYERDEKVRNADFSIVPFVAFIAESIFTLVISYLTRCLSAHNIILVFSCVFCTSMFFSSFILNPDLFCWVYGLSLGSLSASIFLPSVWIIWNQLPENKAFSSGILLSGYSLGSIPFSIIFTLSANPGDHKAYDIEENDRMFGVEVADEVPSTLRWSSLFFLLTVLIGLSLLPRSMEKEEDLSLSTTSSISSDLSPPASRLISSPSFWHLSFMVLCSITCQSYIQIVYKVLAIKYINDDLYSTYIGMLAFFVASIGRGLFGYLLSNYYWKKIMYVVYFFETFIMASLYFVLTDKILYGVFMVTYHFFTSAFYNNVLNLIEKAFPGDKLAVSSVLLFQIPGLFMTFVLDKYITHEIGYFPSFLIVAALNAILFLQVYIYKDYKGERLILLKTS